jgi:hypothetical protein
VTPPDPERVRVSLAAIRTDAQAWEDVGREVQVAADTAAALQLRGLHFSYFADRLGMTSLYQEVQQRIVALLNEGAAVHKDIATRLRAAADGYERADETAERQQRGVF